MKYNKHLEHEIIIFLRYRNQSPGNITKTYMPLKHIANHISKSITYVAQRCKLYQAVEPVKNGPTNFKNLEQ